MTQRNALIAAWTSAFAVYHGALLTRARRTWNSGRRSGNSRTYLVHVIPLGRRLREAGVSIVGPGARPYRRNRQFAPLAEQLCGYLMEPKPEAIVAIERALFNTLLDVYRSSAFDIFSYEGRAIAFKLIHAAQKLYAKEMGGIIWLETARPPARDELRKRR